MANTVFITELATLSGGFSVSDVAVPVMPPLAEQALTVSGASALSNQLNASTRFVILHAEVAACFAFGTAAVVASATAHQFAAGETRIYAVNPASYIAAILPTN